MNSCPALLRLVQAGTALTAVALMAGCGDSYRPVVTSTSTSGPSAEITSYAVTISATSATAAGYATIIDYSGDSIMAAQPIGIGPTNFFMDELGSEGYTLGSDGVLYNFPISTTLQTKNILETTVDSSAKMTNFLAPASGLWSSDANSNAADYFTGSPETFNRAISVHGSQPVAVAGPGTSSGQYQYVLSQNLSDSAICNSSPTSVTAVGSATPITISTLTAGSAIALGTCPVYGVQDSALKRLFVLNRGSDTITVINTETNALDSCSQYTSTAGATVTCHPTIPLSTTAMAATGITPVGCNTTTNPTCGLPTKAGPVFAEYNVTNQQLIVADYDGGTMSVIDVPLDKYGNDSNTYDATGATSAGFGAVHSITVGNYPASVTALYDGSKAYSANQGDGTVTVVNLSSYTVEKTLTVVGHPRTVVSTQNSNISKIYAAAPDSDYLTVIKSSGTSTDEINTTILTQGNILDVRVTTQNGTVTNPLYVSRTPGYGSPCNLPPSSSYWTSNSMTLANCRAIPATAN